MRTRDVYAFVPDLPLDQKMDRRSSFTSGTD